MVVLKTKTKRGYGTVTLEHVTLKDAQNPGISYTGYVVKRNDKSVSAMRSNKKDATKFFKRECGRVFGPASVK
jgi:hypothetical protein